MNANVATIETLSMAFLAGAVCISSHIILIIFYDPKWKRAEDPLDYLALTGLYYDDDLLTEAIVDAVLLALSFKISDNMWLTIEGAAQIIFIMLSVFLLLLLIDFVLWKQRKGHCYNWLKRKIKSVAILMVIFSHIAVCIAGICLSFDMYMVCLEIGFLFSIAIIFLRLLYIAFIRLNVPGKLRFCRGQAARLAAVNACIIVLYVLIYLR